MPSCTPARKFDAPRHNHGGFHNEQDFRQTGNHRGVAQKLVEAAVAKARELKVPQCVAVVDDGGNLKAFVRMDGAALIPIEIAQSKAYTALFGFPTHEFFNFIKGDPSLVAGIPSRARVAAFGGGYPIKIDGAIIGAIGVSGGSVEQDMQCAEAALQLVK